MARLLVRGGRRRRHPRDRRPRHHPRPRDRPDEGRLHRDRLPRAPHAAGDHPRLHRPARAADATCPTSVQAQVLGRIRKGTLPARAARGQPPRGEPHRGAPHRRPHPGRARPRRGRAPAWSRRCRSRGPTARIDVDLGGGPGGCTGTCCRSSGSSSTCCRTPSPTPTRARCCSRCGREDDGGVGVSVRDHGPGIPKRDQERIFERFERARHRRTRRRAPVSASTSPAGLATSMGAELDVQSEPGQGAEFTLHLPTPAAGRPPALARPRVAEPSSRWCRGGGRSPRRRPPPSRRARAR